MLLWSDGSPAHIDMSPFQPIENGWEAQLMISRSTLHGTKWLTLHMRLAGDVRSAWESEGKSARARALQVLANYVRLTDCVQKTSVFSISSRPPPRNGAGQHLA